jgi:hypothetical protein
MFNEKRYHDFKIGDYVWLEYLGTVARIDDPMGKYMADTTSPHGIRYATKFEIAEYKIKRGIR